MILNTGENGKEQSITSFWNDLQYIVEDKCAWERRGNSTEDGRTYIIYWNTNEGIIDKSDSLYCLQKITIMLKKVVKEDIITYNIEKIILTDN